MTNSFRDGVAPSAAAAMCSKGLSIQERADASINPSRRSLYHQFHKYHESVSGDLGGDKMWDLMEDIKEKMPGGVRVAFQRASPAEGKDMCVAIITPLMERVHAVLPQAAEMMFVDTTSHVDLTNTSVTLLLTWCPAGAVPLGVLFTDSQSERAYTQGR